MKLSNMSPWIRGLQRCVFLEAKAEYERLSRQFWVREDFENAINKVLNDPHPFQKSDPFDPDPNDLMFRIGSRDAYCLPLENGAQELVMADGQDVSEEEWLFFCSLNLPKQS